MYFRGIGKDRSKTVFHWGKDDSTKKTEVDVKSRTQATIRSPILMPSAANWTAGQLQGLVPAIWTVTEGNTTGTKCNADAGASTSFYEMINLILPSVTGQRAHSTFPEVGTYSRFSRTYSRNMF